jgi:hypothetical protein
LTGLAQLAVLTLLVGTAGVYFSIQTPEQVASSGIQPPPIVVAGRTGLRPVTGALPVIRTGPDTLAQTPPDTDAAQTGDRLDDTTLAGAVIPPELEQVPATPPETPAVTAEQPLALALEELPGTAAGPATATPSPATPATVNPDMRTGQDSPAVETPPRQIAMQTEAVEFLPDNPTRTPAPAQAARELANTWVINLASYNFESMAKRKLATFHNKGVNAELVRITVKGKPMIRIRTTGYTSAREARDWVALLEERLGLQGAWVAKYQPGEE